MMKKEEKVEEEGEWVENKREKNRKRKERKIFKQKQNYNSPVVVFFGCI